MAIIEQPPRTAGARPGRGGDAARDARRLPPPHDGTTGWKSWLFTVDHKKIGIMYGVAAMAFFVVGGIEALLIRLQLAQPNGTILSAGTYNEMFTMHGTTMVFLFVMPMAAAFANYLVPLQIGARDVAFPRLNAFGLLDVPVRRPLPLPQPVPRRCPRRRLVRLRAQHRPDLLAEPRHGLLGHRPADHRHRLADRARST